MPMLKRYVEESRGVPAQDGITDIAPLNNATAERLGYPTQKPEALFERIIQVSSNEERLDRRWIGIDIFPTAMEIMRRRIKSSERNIGTRVDDKALLRPSIVGHLGRDRRDRPSGSGP